MNLGNPILILGASGRAAAFSALRAGQIPTVIDLFGDEDLRAVAECRVIPAERYPDGLVEMARAVAPMPWMYTGGLENRPDLIARIAAERPLIGNGPKVLTKVRDPFTLASAWREAGIPHPRVARSIPKDDPARWLCKPVRSCGGAGIHFAGRTAEAGEHRYFQEFIEGDSRSAIFRDRKLLGVTRQLVGEPWLHAPRFGYCGSIGPLTVSPTEWAAWQRLGEVLADWAGIHGVYGIDAIVRDGAPWPVEVNPRYTAAVEVIELASQCGKSLAKGAYFAPRDLTIPDNGPWEAWRTGSSPPAFADVPRAGSWIRRGRPVLTIFGQGEADLRATAEMFDRRLADDAQRAGAGRRQ